MPETTRETVLRVLAGQSDGYLIDAGASAFVAEGLGEDEVQAVLDELASEGKASDDERHVQDEATGGAAVDRGWRITASGRAEHGGGG